jgi:hypothetical protein
LKPGERGRAGGFLPLTVRRKKLFSLSRRDMADTRLLM